MPNAKHIRRQVSWLSAALLTSVLFTSCKYGASSGMDSASVSNVNSDAVGECGDPATRIHEIQGGALVSPDIGSIREVEGVVTGVFQGAGFIGGYYMQEEHEDFDDDPLTSEGLRIFDNTNSPAVGEVVRVRGKVTEFKERTELESIESFLTCGFDPATPTAVSLPVTDVTDLERYENMLVSFPQTLTISAYFDFNRYGVVGLTSAPGRYRTPTAEFEPGPDALASEAAFRLDFILLDDGRSDQNPDPSIHPDGSIFGLQNLFRGGDRLDGVTGVMDFANGEYRIQHTRPPIDAVVHTATNPRPAAPADVGGTLKVAAFNVLNYFTTRDDSGSICGPLSDQSCRGADDANEFRRQRDKIVAAIAALDADIVGLIEIENHPGDVPVADLVAGLNTQLGEATYDFISTGAVGADVIRQAIIYRPGTVTPQGSFEVLDSSVDPTFNDDKNRPVIAQSFEEIATAGRLTVAVAHLKSKGSPCDDIGDPDLNDGAGRCNQTRATAATAIANWLATDPTGSGEDDFLVIGDLNSHSMEDPINVLKAAGFTDLAERFIGPDAYSFTFSGRIGYLDYAMASANLLPRVTGMTFWNINADEPDLLNYDTSYKEPAQQAIYAPDAYASSDHDPVLVGLELRPDAE